MKTFSVILILISSIMLAYKLAVLSGAVPYFWIGVIGYSVYLLCSYLEDKY